MRKSSEDRPGVTLIKSGRHRYRLMSGEVHKMGGTAVYNMSIVPEQFFAVQGFFVAIHPKESAGGRFCK